MSKGRPKQFATPTDRSGPPKNAGGRAQLTLVEHALCPLDTSAGLSGGLVHRTEFFYQDENRHTRKAVAEVSSRYGLSPADEFYLWGLMALTLSQAEPSFDFYATPHYCLTALRVIDPAAGQGARGGKNYALFRQALSRLASVNYTNDRFYDPIRGEHRRVAFGFLSYSLPADPASSRAWRIVWDPIFFEFCQAARGSLHFDLETYRSLDFASRRLFLLLQKIFYRNPQSPSFDLRNLGVDVLGFSPGLEAKHLREKLARCAHSLAGREIITLPTEAAGGAKGLFEKKGVGAYSVRFRRGPYFDRKPERVPNLSTSESPLRGPLQSIGFEAAAVDRIVGRYKPQLVQVWADITLAAMEKSPGFFKVSPQAYFMDNIEKASRGSRTPPDWWLEHRKAEDRRERDADRTPAGHEPDPRGDEKAFEDYLSGEGRATFAEIKRRLVDEFRSAGQSPGDAERHAVGPALTSMRSRFRRERPEPSSGSPTPLGDVLKRFDLRDRPDAH